MSASRRSQVTGIALGIALSVGPAVLTALAKNWYVAPCDNPPCGDGSLANPWDLQTALNPNLQPPPPGRVQAGDTVWLLGGTYNGNYESFLEGDPDKPIIVRSIGDGAAKIDGGSYNEPGGAILRVLRGYTWFWGIQVMSSSTDRTSVYQVSQIPPDIGTTVGIRTPAVPNNLLPGLKFINMVIHDTAEGFFMLVDAEGVEFYGNIIYYNGWHAPDRGHGYGIYVKYYLPSATLPVIVKDNIVLAHYGMGIVGSPDTAGYVLNDMTCEGNIVFYNGVLNYEADHEEGFEKNFTIGDSRVYPVRPKLINNYTYFAPDNEAARRSPGNNRLGYTSSCTHATVTGNYFVTPYRVWDPPYPCAGRSFQFQGTDLNAIANNIFYGRTSNDPNDVDLLAAWRSGYGNIFYDCACWPPPCSGPLPTGVEVFVRPNEYEGKRGHVAVYNWDDVNDVLVDVSEILSPGDLYHVVDPQNYFGPPVASGTYLGGSILMPMTSTATATSSAGFTPQHTSKQFGAFVVKRVFYQQEGPERGGP